MAHGKEWSPKTYAFSSLEEIFIYFLEESITNQRALTKYFGNDEGFNAHVADNSWDHYQFKLIGENTGYIMAVLDFAGELGFPLSPALVRRAYLYAYTA